MLLISRSDFGEACRNRRNSLNVEIVVILCTFFNSTAHFGKSSVHFSSLSGLGLRNFHSAAAEFFTDKSVLAVEEGSDTFFKILLIFQKYRIILLFILFSVNVLYLESVLDCAVVIESRKSNRE